MQVAAGQVHASVHLIDWDNPENNDFALAEEVSLKGGGLASHQRRPDIVLYLNGILRRRWATMDELMSAGERKLRIIASLIEDFSLKPRLNNDRGTALLVVASIYDACRCRA